MKAPHTFHFRRYALRPDGQTVDFVYAIDDVEVTETLVFHTNNVITLTPLVERVLFGLHLMLGISYYKAFCPKKIIVSSGTLTQTQATFWNTVYTKGLGQFFFENALDYRDAIQFPANTQQPQSVCSTKHTGRILVPLGGGKDSLVTIALFKQHNMPFDLFTLGDHAILAPQITQIGAHEINVTRTLDPQLLQWNTEGAYNGHIPISAIFSWTSLLVAAIDGYQYIALSNEASANEGNVEYLGSEINHQWSKSLDYEKLFQTYVKQFVTPDISYFSVLRPHSEIAITKLFAEKCTEYFTLFTSCNRNFAITKKASQRFCGTCPKCAFVFGLLSAYIPKEDLLNMFGKNLYADETLVDMYRELCGIKNFKPFECVGTPNEMIYALQKAHGTHTYDTNAVIQMFVTEIMPRTAQFEVLEQQLFSPREHAIPKEIYTKLYESS